MLTFFRAQQHSQTKGLYVRALITGEFNAIGIKPGTIMAIIQYLCCLVSKQDDSVVALCNQFQPVSTNTNMDNKSTPEFLPFKVYINANLFDSTYLTVTKTEKPNPTPNP